MLAQFLQPDNQFIITGELPKKVIYDKKTGFLRFGDKTYTIKVLKDGQALKFSDKETQKISKLAAEILNQQVSEQLQNMTNLDGVKISHDKIELGQKQPEVKTKDHSLYLSIQEIVQSSLTSTL